MFCFRTYSKNIIKVTLGFNGQTLFSLSIKAQYVGILQYDILADKVHV